MTEKEVLEIFHERHALLTGHFKLSSGLHSQNYLQCALILQHPDIAEKLANAIAKKFFKDKIDLVIVPGIAFDKQNNRMGRGKAFYDGILNKLSGVKVGVCFRFQIVENVPTDEHDIKMNYVITN